MRETLKTLVPILLLVVGSSLTALGCGITLGLKHAEHAIKDIQSKAVEAGVAEYVVIDSAGNTEFRWKSPTPEQDRE